MLSNFEISAILFQKVIITFLSSAKKIRNMFDKEDCVTFDIEETKETNIGLLYCLI